MIEASIEKHLGKGFRFVGTRLVLDFEFYWEIRNPKSKFRFPVSRDSVHKITLTSASSAPLQQLMYRSNWSFKNIHPLGIPRAFDCALCPERGEFERCLGRVGNLNRIYLLFWRNTLVSFFGFCKDRISPLLVNNSFKGSSKEVWRCRHGTSRSEKREQCLIEEEICLWGEVFQNFLVRHLNNFFAPRGGNLNKPIFKSSNARGVARGWMLKLRFDWYIALLVPSGEVSLFFW